MKNRVGEVWSDAGVTFMVIDRVSAEEHLVLILDDATDHKWFAPGTVELWPDDSASCPWESHSAFQKIA